MKIGDLVMIRHGTLCGKMALITKNNVLGNQEMASLWIESRVFHYYKRDLEVL